MKQDEYISKYIVVENEPTNAPWGERFFIFANQMAINYHLQSHCFKLISNLVVSIVVFCFQGNRLT